LPPWKGDSRFHGFRVAFAALIVRAPNADIGMVPVQAVDKSNT
jgi:hypothetical protein